MKTMTLGDFQNQVMSQDVGRHEDYAFVCPMCGVVQSARSLIDAGAGNSFSQVEKYLGFSCIGRFTGAGAPRKAPDGKPCNWTLGGLLLAHQLEVVTPDGKHHPHFEIATPEQAKALKGGAA